MNKIFKYKFMKRQFLILLMGLFTHFLLSQALVPLDSISNHIGATIKVCDKVMDTFMTKGERKIAYLNFGGRYPDHKFTVVMFMSKLPESKNDPVVYYKDKNICVIGELTLYKDKPQIVLKAWEQIELKI